MQFIILPNLTSVTLSKYFILLMLLSSGCSVELRAQDPSASPGQDIQFEHLTNADGLVSDFAFHAIVQDQQGFLWVGTINGLNRYDGYLIKSYRHNPLDSTSISHNNITALFVDHYGVLWVGTRGGLNRYDPALVGRMTDLFWSGEADFDASEPQLERLAEAFTRYRHDPHNPASLSSDTVNVLLETGDSVLWVGTDRGLSRLDRRTGTFTHFQYDPDDGRSLSGKTVNTLYEDREGRLWIGTSNPGGLSRFESTTGSGFIRVLSAANAPSIGSGVTTLGEDRQGAFYVGTCRGILYRYDRVGERLEALLPDPNDPNRLHAPPVEASNTECTPVEVIHEDRTGMLWVGTYTGGLNRYDPATHTLTKFRHNPADPTSLSSNGVRSFYEDRQGVYWVGTQQNGLNKSVPSSHRFRLYGGAEIRANGGVRGLYEDTEGMIWIGTASGQLFRFDPTTRTFERFSSPEPAADGLWTASIFSVFKDQAGMLWVGQQPGLYRIDPLRGIHTSFFHDPADPHSLSHSDINAIKEDGEGTLWISTHGGLNRYDRRTERFIRFTHDPADARSLSDNSVTPLYQDRRGVRWFGTFGRGINRFDEKTETFTTYLDGTGFQTIYEDTAGRFWVATWGDGLYLLDRDTGRARQFRTEDGLPNDVIAGLMEDDLGLLWLDTPSGLARFNPSTTAFITYSKDDGLDNHTVVNGRALRSRNGKLYLGGQKGLTEIDPKEFTLNSFPPTVVITSLRVFEESRTPSGSPEAPLLLRHDENELTFSYVGLHFTNPSRNRYAYRLEGYETNWRQAGTVREASYTSLPSGTYTFRVKASNSDGVWNEEGASLTITILPPWWRTWWAYTLYGLLMMAAVAQAYRWQHARIVRREREAAREREREQAREIERAYHELRDTKDRLVQQEKMASLGALTAGIAHEIKNPLNFINNFAEVNEELAEELREALENGEDLTEIIDDMEQNASVIKQHGKRADGIVHAMMQHASGGTGQRESTDINQLVSEHIDLAYHGKRAQVPGFTAEIERDLGEEAGIVEVVPQEIGRVLLNLLGNAFDAVHERALSINGPEGPMAIGPYAPTVQVATQRVGDQVEIRVSDNGLGIPSEIKEKIFEPFFTTKPTGSGTGLGLSLSYDIIAQGHGGTLTVEGNEDAGATFIIRLPAAR